MTQLIDDLLDAVVTRFGDTIPLRRDITDLGRLVREVGDEVGATSPVARISVETSGNPSEERGTTFLISMPCHEAQGTATH